MSSNNNQTKVLIKSNFIMKEGCPLALFIVVAFITFISEVDYLL